MAIDEKALRVAGLAVADMPGDPACIDIARTAILAYESAKQKEAPTDAGAGMPSEEDLRAALYLGFDPYAPKTWAAETVNRLSRIHSEQGGEAFLREVSKLTSVHGGIASPLNACRHRDECRALLARALSAESKLAEQDALIRDLRMQALSDDGQMQELQAKLAQAVEALGPFAWPPLYVFDKDQAFVPTTMPEDWIGGGYFTTDDFRRARDAAALASARGEK